MSYWTLLSADISIISNSVPEKADKGKSFDFKSSFLVRIASLNKPKTLYSH